MENPQERETTPDEAMGALQGEDPRAVRANTGEAAHELGRNRFGTIVLNTWVEAIQERRTMPVTEEQARDIIVRAGTRPTDGVTLRLVPYDEVLLDNPNDQD